MTSADTALTISEYQNRIADLEQQLAAARRSLSFFGPLDGNEAVGVELLRFIIEDYPGGMVFSRQGKIINANQGLAKMLGRPLESLIGRAIIDLVVEEDREIVRAHLEQNDTGPYEHRLIGAGGKPVPVEATASLVPAETGRPFRFTVIRDISDRRIVEDNLDKQRRLLQTILDHMPAGVFVADAPSCRPVLINQFARGLVEKSEIHAVPQENLSVEYRTYVAGTDEHYPYQRLPIVRALSGEESSVDDVELRFDDGSRKLLQIYGAPIYDAHGNITMSVAVTQDITAHKLAEANLRAEQDFLRVLIKAHERDRQLMSYEIHDGLVQYITAAVWHLDSVCEKASLDAESRETLAKSQSLLRQAITDARRVLSGLRPPVLDEQGIVIALDYLAAESIVPGTLDITVVKDVRFTRLEPLLEGTIFRIVQESLNNVRKHSQARHAQVSLTQIADRIELKIEDDGRGFKVDNVPRERFGLLGIRKRAELIGGAARIESANGQGTRVIVDLPLLPFVEDSSD